MSICANLWSTKTTRSLWERGRPARVADVIGSAGAKQRRHHHAHCPMQYMTFLHHSLFLLFFLKPIYKKRPAGHQPCGTRNFFLLFIFYHEIITNALSLASEVFRYVANRGTCAAYSTAHFCPQCVVPFSL